MSVLKWSNGTKNNKSSLNDFLNKKKDHEKSDHDKLDHENSEKKLFNKREDIDSKLSLRQLNIQTGQNIYLNKSNYINDLEIQESYLKPINSNYFNK